MTTAQTSFSRWARHLAVWAAACLLALPAVGAAATSEPGVYGKTLVGAYDLPPEALAKFEEFQAAKKGKPSGGGMFADAEEWSGPVLTLSSEKNPYVIVVKVTGTAIADGDAASGWVASWRFENGSPLSAVPPLVKKNAKAGDRVALEGASRPVSFKEDRSPAPTVGYVESQNLKIDAVSIEVWSGVGSGGSWISKLFAWSPLLVGLVALGLAIWFRRSS
jgi:hypothetical protein